MIGGPIKAKPRVPLFEAEPTIEGFDVIDVQTGRPMGFPRETRREANGVAQTLNNVAASGKPGALARALRAG
jgi:hypothetical protein